MCFVKDDPQARKGNADCLSCRATGSFSVSDLEAFHAALGLSGLRLEPLELVEAYTAVPKQQIRHLARHGVVRYHGDHSVTIREGPFGREHFCDDCGVTTCDDEAAIGEWREWWLRRQLPAPPVPEEPRLPGDLVLRRLELQRITEIADIIEASDALRDVREAFEPLYCGSFPEDPAKSAAYTLLTRARSLVACLRERTPRDFQVDLDMEAEARARLGIYELLLDIAPIGGELLAATMRYIAAVDAPSNCVQRQPGEARQPARVANYIAASEA